MAIQFDKDRLRRAVVLLLDSRWGPNREQRVREAVGMLPKRTRPFTGAVEALNEEVEQRYERAKQTGAIKASTHRVSNSKLDALQSKFNRR